MSGNVIVLKCLPFGNIENTVYTTTVIVYNQN